MFIFELDTTNLSFFYTQFSRHNHLIDILDTHGLAEQGKLERSTTNTHKQNDLKNKKKRIEPKYES